MTGDGIRQVENILAAVAAAWALGMEPDLIRNGIEGLQDFNKSSGGTGAENTGRTHAEPAIADRELLGEY